MKLCSNLSGLLQRCILKDEEELLATETNRHTAVFLCHLPVGFGYGADRFVTGQMSAEAAVEAAIRLNEEQYAS